MTPLYIPPDFNRWPRKKQVEYYLDLGWRIQPVYGPNDPRSDRPGKQPRLTERERMSLTREDVLRMFANGSPDNVGQVPCAPHATLDLDDEGNGDSLAFFFKMFPDFAQRPHVKSSELGAHIHLLCPDLPEGFKKLSSKNFLPKLNAELFIHPSGNVVLPPSIHACGNRYEWIGSGVLPVVNWPWLRDTFRFGSEPEARETSLEWMRRYKGDLRSLDLVGLCRRLGIYRGEQGDE